MPTHTERRIPRRASLSLPLAGALLAVTAGSALAQSPSTAPIGAIDHPTGSTDIVLSMETGGGFVPFGYLLSQAPTFVLYGDNTVIFRPSDVPTDGTTYAPFVEAHLSNEQVDALLTYALSVGRLADAADSYTDMLITDAPTTVFTIDAAGIEKAVSVYALGIVDPEGPDAADYAAFEELATLLSTFEEQVEKGNVLSAELYEPELYRVVLSQVDPSQVDAAGTDKAVSVYALGIVDPEGPDAADYAAFEELATLLSTFEEQVEKGNVLSAELYEPELYRVVLSQVDPSQVDAAGASAVAWPWAELTPADFTAFPENAAWSYAGLSPEQLSAIATVPSGGGMDAYVTAPDGTTTYQVFWRPLLPGEDVAPDVTGGGKGF